MPSKRSSLITVFICVLVACSNLPDSAAQSLSLGERVPSGVPESHSSASASNCPDPITRGSARFNRILYPVYNSDIEFKDEDCTAANRYMTSRCAQKLENLARLVKNEWCGVKVQVTKAWDEDNERFSSSLHDCGRAVDLTTSDRDQSKYGRLGQLAVDAGFDFVWYYNSLHIHASVKQCDSNEFACDNGACVSSSRRCDNYDDCGDNSDERGCSLNSCANNQFQCNDGKCIPSSCECNGNEDCRDGEDEHSGCNSDGSGGGSGNNSEPCCFPGSAIVQTRTKNVSMDKLEIGNEVLVLNEQGKITYGPVIAFLDHDAKRQAKYVTIESEDGTSMTLTEAHLIYKANEGSAWQLQKMEDILPVFASKVKVNDHIFTRSNQRNELKPSKVIRVTNTRMTGAYAPLTLEGTIIVNNALASCYAVIDDHRLAHTALAPLRFLYRSMPSLLRERGGDELLSWYPTLLETVGRMVLDETHFHPSLVERVVRKD